MPVSKSKQGKPLGGIGAERQSGRTHSLVIDDRLLSKQYITNKLDARVSNDAFSSSWADVTDIAPSKNTLNNKFNALSVTTSAWTQESAVDVTSKTRTFDSGNVGIGSTLAYSAIDEKLVVDGNIKALGNLISTGDASIGDDLSLISDASIFNFGADSDVNLTHVADTGLLLNSTRKIQFHDASQYIGASSAADLDIAATTDINLNCTTVDINGNADISGTLAVAGNTTISGNLTVTGTATAIETTNISTKDNIIVLNSEESGTGVTATYAGFEIERGSYANVGLRFDESANAWQIQAATDNSSAGAWSNISTSESDHGAVTIDNQGLALLTLSTQAITVNDVMVRNSGDTMTGQLVCSGTSGSGGTTALSVVGGDSGSSNAAVSITGHLEATTKSFNIPHPLLNNKRLVYGSLEGPEHGMYQRGSFDIEDERRIVAIDLPVYWSAMTYEDYTVNLTTYGDYNVWISNRDENGFWVETNAEKEWSFDWNVIAGRKDAKLVVEPDA